MPETAAAPEAAVEAAAELIAYKGFGPDWTCRGFAYEVGKTYEIEGEPRLCERGFHACPNPLDVFAYYPPAGSRFAEVRYGGTVVAGDGKIACTRITVVAEIRLGDMIERAVKATMVAAKWVKGSQATGFSGAASATGDSGAASATGFSGAASATGRASAAMASGRFGRACASEGSALFLVERDDNWNITAVFAGIAGRDGILPDTFYTLRDGKPVAAEG